MLLGDIVVGVRFFVSYRSEMKVRYAVSRSIVVVVVVAAAARLSVAGCTGTGHARSTRRKLWATCQLSQLLEEKYIRSFVHYYVCVFCVSRRASASSSESRLGTSKKACVRACACIVLCLHATRTAAAGVELCFFRVAKHRQKQHCQNYNYICEL